MYQVAQNIPQRRSVTFSPKVILLLVMKRELKIAKPMVFLQLKQRERWALMLMDA